MKVKFANKIYEVKDTRILPGGVVQYAIEDEPGHIDWLTNAEIVDGMTYGVKEGGEPYPKLPARFE